MLFFHGFALRDEEHFFSEYLEKGSYVVSGFSYGAIQAFEYALSSQQRIDTLQLFSPAFFQNSSTKFKRLQMMGYTKSAETYISRFTENCFLPYAPREVSYSKHSAEELEVLLNHVWSDQELETLRLRGTKIEVYLGSEDKISDAISAKDFFTPYAEVTLIKGANHFLQGE